MKLRTVQMMILLLAMFRPGLLQGQKANTEQESNPRPCNLKVSNSPSVRGLRLGMTTDQLLALFPGSRVDPKIQNALVPDYGLATATFHLYSDSNPLFSNVSLISVKLFDGSLSAIRILYKGPPWKSVDDMVAKVAASLNLPSVENWASTGQYSKSLKCDGFYIRVIGSQSGGELELEIPNLWDKARERQAAEEEKARQNFKP